MSGEIEIDEELRDAQEIRRLAEFLAEKYPERLGPDDRAVDVAIRIIERQIPPVNRERGDVIASMTAKLAHLDDVYAALGVKWGEDPFARIKELELSAANRTPDQGPILRIFHDVVKERARQVVTKGYDEEHDDGHTVGQFANIIRDKVGRAAQAEVVGGVPGRDEARRRLVQVVALGVAAIESLDRKTAGTEASHA